MRLLVSVFFVFIVFDIIILLVCSNQCWRRQQQQQQQQRRRQSGWQRIRRSAENTKWWNRKILARWYNEKTNAQESIKRRRIRNGKGKKNKNEAAKPNSLTNERSTQNLYDSLSDCWFVFSSYISSFLLFSSRLRFVSFFFKFIYLIFFPFGRALFGNSLALEFMAQIPSTTLICIYKYATRYWDRIIQHSRKDAVAAAPSRSASVLRIGSEGCGKKRRSQTVFFSSSLSLSVFSIIFGKWAKWLLVGIAYFGTTTHSDGTAFNSTSFQLESTKSI